MSYSSFNVFADSFYNFIFAILGVLGAHFCGDSETGRHRHAEKVHLGEVSAFTAKEIQPRHE